MHRSRFTAHGKPWHLRQRRRAAGFRDTIEHFEDVSRNLRLNDPLARGQRIEILTQQRERSSYATVCQNGVGTCELNRCRGQTITKGKRDFFDVAPVRQIRQLAGALPGKPVPVVSPSPKRYSTSRMASCPTACAILVTPT